MCDEARNEALCLIQKYATAGDSARSTDHLIRLTSCVPTARWKNVTAMVRRRNAAARASCRLRKPVEAPKDDIPVESAVEPDQQGDPAPQMTEQAPLPPNLAELHETSDEDALPEDVPMPPLAWLVVKSPASMRGMVFTVAPGQVIGREGDVRWPDGRLSRQHARLTLEPADTVPDAMDTEAIAVFHLWPFAPKNPVYINGQAIRGATPLFENDEIRLGDTLLVFKVLMD